MRIAVLLYGGEGGGYWAKVPALPGVYAQGETREELATNLRRAVGLYLSVRPGEWPASREAGAELVEVEV